MATLIRWLSRAVVLAVAVALLGLAGVWYLASRSLPDYEDTETVTGLNGPVEILRDAHGVPHIRAGSDTDAFFALGYAHAQDRLWQMTMLRRTAQGRLSELFGERTLAIDDLLRRLDIYGLSQASVAAQTPEARAVLEAYAAGVNARIDVVNRHALGRGAPEFFLFSSPIEPWSPADSLSILRLMSLQLASHLQEEVLRAQLATILPPERIADIRPAPPRATPVDLSGWPALFGPDARFDHADAATPRPRDPLDPVAPVGLGGASNFWAAAGVRATGGAPLLANDPHLGLTAPTIWMQAHLELSTGGIIGGTIPGLPLVLLGRSDRLAWGLTSSYLDDQDLMIEKINPENPEEYLTPAGYKPFRTREVLIRVKGRDEPVRAVLRWTENGPVLPPDSYDLGSITPAGHVAALAWTALTPDDTSFSAGLALIRAGSVEEAMTAAEGYRAPSQNLVLADREHIGWLLIGAIPQRDPGHETRGILPAPGWKPQNRWRGFFPPGTNPRIIDPETGVLANTNNQTVDAPFPRHISYSWGDTQRIERLRTLMQGRLAHSRESFMETQADAVSPAARALLPLVGRGLWQVEPPANADRRALLRYTALGMLAEWNGDMNEHLAEPLIYAAWMRELQAFLIADKLGKLSSKFPRPEPVFLERVFRDIDGAAQWCDMKATDRVETCQQAASIALDRALDWLSERYGDDPTRWRWGEAHQAKQDHPVLGGISLLGWLVNIRQSTSGGDHTLNRARMGDDPDNPFWDVHAAGYRGVYDMSDPESSVYVIATGTSGHPLSGLYDDQAQLWRRGEYIQMTMDPALYSAGALGTTRLLPRGVNE